MLWAKDSEGDKATGGRPAIEIRHVVRGLGSQGVSQQQREEVCHNYGLHHSGGSADNSSAMMLFRALSWRNVCVVVKQAVHLK